MDKIFRTVLAAMALAWLLQVWWCLPTRPKPGEASYLGKSSQTWEAEISRRDVWRPTCGTGGGPPVRCDRPSSFIRPILQSAGIATRATTDEGEIPLLNGDPEAMPVLVELLQSPKTNVRMVAIEGLRRMGEQARPAVPALIAATEDEDVYIAGDAASVLIGLHEDASIRWLHSPPASTAEISD